MQEKEFIFIFSIRFAVNEESKIEPVTVSRCILIQICQHPKQGGNNTIIRFFTLTSSKHESFICLIARIRSMWMSDPGVTRWHHNRIYPQLAHTHKSLRVHKHKVFPATGYHDVSYYSV